MERIRVLHDLDIKDSVFEEKYPCKDVRVISASPSVKHCIGCFGCWIKTPGRCVIKDRGNIITDFMAECNELVVISEIFYGGFSPDVKAMLDRSIGYIMPFFRIVNNEMHHTMRYDKQFHYNVHFYGQDITSNEKQLAQNIVQANAVNMGALSCSIEFYESANHALEGLK